MKLKCRVLGSKKQFIQSFDIIQILQRNIKGDFTRDQTKELLFKRFWLRSFGLKVVHINEDSYFN